MLLQEAITLMHRVCLGGEMSPVDFGKNFFSYLACQKEATPGLHSWNLICTLVQKGYIPCAQHLIERNGILKKSWTWSTSSKIWQWEEVCYSLESPCGNLEALCCDQEEDEWQEPPVNADCVLASSEFVLAILVQPWTLFGQWASKNICHRETFELRVWLSHPGKDALPELYITGHNCLHVIMPTTSIACKRLLCSFVGMVHHSVLRTFMASICWKGGGSTPTSVVYAEDSAGPWLECLQVDVLYVNWK